MSVTQCSGCGTPVSSQGRFCGSCGAPVAALQPAIDPLGRVSAPPAPAAPASLAAPSALRPAAADATLSALGIPSAPRTPGARTVPSMRDMDWTEGAVIALIALLPAILVGMGLFFWQDGTGLSLPASIGASVALTFGGSMGASGSASLGFAAGQADLFIVNSSVTFAAISGLVLFVGARRLLRRADSGDLGSYLRSVTPTVVVFIAGAVILSALARGATVPFDGVPLTLSPPLVRVFFLSALLVAVAAGVALISRARFSIPSLDRVWKAWSAPLFAVTVLILLVGSVTILGGSIATLVLTGWDWRGLLLIPLGGFYFIEVAVSALALGTLSSVGIGLEGGLIGSVGQLGSSGSMQTSESMDAFRLIELMPWLGIVVLLLVNALGIFAAAAMILRRRDASVARRDLGAWVASFFVIGVLTVTLVVFRIEVSADFASVVGAGSGSGGVWAGVSSSVILLLPIFAAGWWLLARLLLPRLPASSLLRMSEWARVGL